MRVQLGRRQGFRCNLTCSSSRFRIRSTTLFCPSIRKRLIDIVSNAASRRDGRVRVKLPPIRREQIYLAVHRYDDSVYYRRIQRETFQLLRALRDGVSVAEAAARAFETSRLTPSGQVDCLRESFS